MPRATSAPTAVDTLGGIPVLQEKAPTIGDYFGYDDTFVLDALCSNWPYPIADLPTEYDAEGADPILVIGTSNDPATPYANAVSLSKQLSSGVLISYEGEGHTIYAQGVECVDSRSMPTSSTARSPRPTRCADQAPDTDHRRKPDAHFPPCRRGGGPDRLRRRPLRLHTARPADRRR